MEQSHGGAAYKEVGTRRGLMTNSAFLRKHFDLIEKQLLCMSEIATGSGHPVLKGTAREHFVKQFLRDHIGESIGIGSGEVFDSKRIVGDRANQIDVLLYDTSFPKVHFGGTDVAAFMVESIHAGIEVKSNLTRKELETTLRCARNLKSLKMDERARTITKAHGTPYYLFAYDGPTIETVQSWLIDIERESRRIHEEKGAEFVELIPRHLDGIFVLGKGFILDTSMANSALHACSRAGTRNGDPFRWLSSGKSDGILYCLFFLLNFNVHYNFLDEYFTSVLDEYNVVPWNDDTTKPAETKE
jgi:hypothetical protein